MTTGEKVYDKFSSTDKGRRSKCRRAIRGMVRVAQKHYGRDATELGERSLDVDDMSASLCSKHSDKFCNWRCYSSEMLRPVNPTRIGSIRSGAGKDRRPGRAVDGATRNTLSIKLLCFIPFCSCLGQSNSSIIPDGKDFFYT